MTMQRGKERNISDSLSLSLTKTQLCDQSNNSQTPDAMTLVPRFPPFPKMNVEFCSICVKSTRSAAATDPIFMTDLTDNVELKESGKKSYI